MVIGRSFCATRRVNRCERLARIVNYCFSLAPDGGRSMVAPTAASGRDLALELGALVRNWGLREVRPRIRELEEKGEFPRELYRQMGQLGLFGCCFPERLGG